MASTAKLVEAGIDWLTGTASAQETQDVMIDLWNAIKARHEVSRAFVRKAAWQGYAGERIEHGFFGWRQDGCCVIVSGQLSALYARDFLDVGARPSRLDLQVTGQVDGLVSSAVERMFGDARLFKPTVGSLPALKMFVGRQGAEGLYVGRRTSEVMLRIYDKYQESRQAVYKGCLRVEVEAKQATAQNLARTLLQAKDDREVVPGILRNLCAARGLTIPFETGGPDVVLYKTRHLTTTESKMAWLRSQVSPTVQALMEDLGESRVMSVLLPDSLDKQAGDDKIQQQD